METYTGNRVILLAKERGNASLEAILRSHRGIDDDRFFHPGIADLADPFLLPDMERVVERILEAKRKKERIVVFGDYDVDGVSGTALLVRYLTEIGCRVSYRLPHRVHDGYGLKEYFFDELKTKSVSLVITVDCGTRDVGPIEYARSVGIDVIVTDHHAVPEVIPESVIGIVNPKRRESDFPFRDLAGAGVAFKLVHALVLRLESDPSHIEKKLREYIDFAALGTVSDCMPLTGENRVIVSLGLEQMHTSRSSGLRRYLAGKERVTRDADIIGFQIGPRINAAGRMDSPLIALQWLLAGDDRADELFEALEHLNTLRRGVTQTYFEKALSALNRDDPVLIYDSHELEHGVLGLIAGKLTEMFGKPAIVLKHGDTHPNISGKGYNTLEKNSPHTENTTHFSIASCRSPEWCNIMELLDACSPLFLRYGGHRQAAGFTIETDRLPELREALKKAFCQTYDILNLPKRSLTVECILDIRTECTLENVAVIDRFRPFGIGNQKPLFLLENVTIQSYRSIGADGKHLEIRMHENPSLRIMAWGWGERLSREEIVAFFSQGNILSLIIELDKQSWNGKAYVQAIVKDIILDTP